MPGNKARRSNKLVSLCILRSVLRWTGGPSGGIPPDPIPNSAVKAPSAYGTAAQAAGESVAASPAKDASLVFANTFACFATTPPHNLFSRKVGLQLRRISAERLPLGYFLRWCFAQERCGAFGFTS